MNFWEYLRKVFSEADGTPSASRFLTGTVIFFSMGWVTTMLVLTRKIPDLAGLAMFDTATVGVLYGTNKITGIFSGNGQKKDMGQ